MTHVPHQIAEDFPEHVERLHLLKIADPRFATLVAEYDEVNRAVYKAETLVEPIAAAAETELRQRRARLKDQIAHFLTGGMVPAQG
ncbi:YdcH family protein [Frigidibacter sp. MR17.24]|uniref:YdcH family protein n=1 Tax=Frigidibacter sp. MR17.24 TaxID=3127345 RepID=UPI0030130ED4